MTNFIKTIAATIVFAASAQTALAGNNTFQTTLPYDNGVSAAENYVLLKTAASKACKKEAIRAGYSAREAKGHVVSKCERQLVDQAVARINQDALISYHAAKTGKASTVKLASTR